MCITTEPARLSNTIIYAAEVQKRVLGEVGRWTGEVVHVIGYQNKANSAPGRPNAMILPLPSAEPLGPANIIDTRKFKNILGSYDKAIERLNPKRRDTRSRGFGTDGVTLSKGFQVFESGSYTVALADRPVTMRLALDHVPEEKRPEIPGSFLAGLGQLYADWPIAICCFKGNLEAPEPLLWWFKPRFPHALFAPAIDAHDGNPPDPNVQVDRDHTLAFASYRSQRANDERLINDIQRDVPAEFQWLFAPSIVGTKIEGRTGNGDFSLPVSAILDDRVPQYIPKIDITPPPKDLPSVYDHILAGGALG